MFQNVLYGYALLLVFKDRANAYRLRLKFKDKFNENIHGFVLT
jgi:hypothetical protein